MTPARFESSLPASERLHTDALDRAATGNGVFQFAILKYKDEGIQNYNFVCSFVLVWNLVFHAEGGIQAEGIRE